MQKQKLLYLQKILLEKTDEYHGLTIDELIAELEKYQIHAERKSLYDDLKNLESFGLDICRCKTNTVRYYVGTRDFEIAELKLLVDAIQSSKFITHKKSLQLINKLGALLSVHQGKNLRREVYVTNRVKNLNEKIYYNVDTIQQAISLDKQICFRYYKWNVDFDALQRLVKRERKLGAYHVSPWSLCWDNDNYYLIAYDSDAQIIKHYRVDKIDSIEVLDEKRDGEKVFADFDIAKYSKATFAMFGGDEVDVTLSADVQIAGVIADRFGSNIFISKESDNRFRTRVKVMLSPQFYAWIFGLGDKIKIISPQVAIDEYKKMLDDIANLY